MSTPQSPVPANITGAMSLEVCQEVIVSALLNAVHQTVAIELGGEDAKII